MIKVLDVNLYDNTLHNAVKLIIEECSKNKRNLCVSATGAHGIITAYHDNYFKSILNYFYLNLPDGMPSVWIGKLKGAKQMQRCYGPEYFRELIVLSANKTIKHYFCGGKVGVAEELKEVCQKTYNNNNIVGSFSPPFREMSDIEFKNLADEINKLQADIIWIGLSTPKQEIFAHRLSKYTDTHFICTVGAAFDFHTGRVIQAPSLIQKIGMEWFFRLVVEPKRLWKRYVKIVPLFLLYNIVEIITGKFFNNQGDNN